MKKIMSVAIILIAAIVFSSCHKISGEGPVVSRSYQLTDFTSVDAGLGGDVYYTQDSFFKVEIEAQENLQNIIEMPIVNGELRIQFEKYKNVSSHVRITIHITAPSLSALGINGSGSLHALLPVSSTNMRLKVNGSGSISVASFTGTTLSAEISGSGDIAVNGGMAKNIATKISGSGKIDLAGIETLDAAAAISGSGKTTLNVKNNLDVHISGSGHVYYTGYPSVHSSISGSGKVTHM